MKPKVFKMGGSWIWVCNSGHGGPVGGDYSEDRWAAPWACAYSRAVDHARRYHDASPSTEVIGEVD